MTSPTCLCTLSLHDALPIYHLAGRHGHPVRPWARRRYRKRRTAGQLARASRVFKRSEEHTSELQSRLHLVCRLLLEKKIYLAPSDEIPDTAILHEPTFHDIH